MKVKRMGLQDEGISGPAKLVHSASRLSALRIASRRMARTGCQLSPSQALSLPLRSPEHFCTVCFHWQFPQTLCPRVIPFWTFFRHLSVAVFCTNIRMKWRKNILFDIGFFSFYLLSDLSNLIWRLIKNSIIKDILFCLRRLCFLRKKQKCRKHLKNGIIPAKAEFCYWCASHGLMII